MNTATTYDVTPNLPAIVTSPALPGTNIFQHPLFGQLRTHVDPGTGQPWFAARDVAATLGYVNLEQAVRTHCNHPKILKQIESSGLTTSPRGITIIPESDVYRLIIRSKLPAAQQFEAWVMEEVLPQIRRTGGYIPVKEADTDLDLMARAVLIAQRTIQEKDVLIEQKQSLIEHSKRVLEHKQATITGQQTVITMQAENIAVMRPKADVFDTHIAPANYMTVTRFARTLEGVNTTAAKRDLHILGYLYRQSVTSGAYRVYARYRDTLFAEKPNPSTGKIDIYVLDKGKQLLARLYLDGRLTLKINSQYTTEIR